MTGLAVTSVSDAQLLHSLVLSESFVNDIDFVNESITIVILHI